MSTRNRTSQADIDQMRRDEDRHILQSWDRITRDRTSPTNSPDSHRQAHNVKG